MIDRNSLLFGFVLGAFVPVLGFVVIEYIIKLLTEIGTLPSLSAEPTTRRMRTIALLSICCILIPFTIAKNKGLDQTMRGMILPTLIYAGSWVYKFQDELFS